MREPHLDTRLRPVSGSLTSLPPRTDVSDMKVYVDLASISAGENDAEMDQVACFHDAATGYAPLLYGLPPHAGLEEFLSCARPVWDAQGRDPKLPDKLVRACPAPR